MPPAWAAERVVSADLARLLIEGQFPGLAPARLEPFGEGFDNTAFLVNGTHVLRFPRRALAVACLEAETRVLAAVAPRLSLPVPAAAFVGRPAEAYPWPFAGYPLIPGRTACAVAPDAAGRAVVAAPLARFLAGLHAVPPAEAVRFGAGPDTLARLDLSRRLPRARDLLDRLARRGLVADARPFRALLGAAPAAYAPRADTLVHGDLYARHLLLDDGGRLAGVIDWGDVHLGDPATDLAVAHAFLPPAAHAGFRAAYGPIGETAWGIARLRALWHTLMVREYAAEVADADLLRESGVALAYLAVAA